jgi:TonB family protein
MGKVVKYCSACEEGFAEKFGFCPNCGAHLTAFEMNPLDSKPAEEIKNTPVEKIEAAPTAPVLETPAETPRAAETQQFSASPVTDETVETKEVFEAENNIVDEDEVETKFAFDAPKNSPAQNIPENLHEATYAKTDAAHYVADGGYQPTIVVEKNAKQRNTLLLGAFALGCILMLGSYVYSMFNKYLDISAIDTPSLVAYVGDDEPAPMEIEEAPKKNTDKGGGGGGGGKEEDTPASKGRTATQTDNPFIAPSSKMDRVTNPELAYRASTQGNRQEKQTDENYGAVQGLSGRSDGTGLGGGIGEGRGTGQGNGNGTGLGNGNGSGSGNGNGNGNGDGDGDGDNAPTVKATPKPAPIGPTEGVKILSKPRANYTDAARQNQVQGKVVLRVTFSANGSIGNISVISGLGNGLTEQAIAAARGIRFEPAKRGGVPYSVTKPVEYTFTIY